MDKHVFGYYIGTDVHFDIKNKTLINVNRNRPPRKNVQIELRDTMLRLLAFLLEHADGTITSNEDILVNVWDVNGLSSSNQRLWQVMKELKAKLCLVGIRDDFIMRVDSKGYYLRENLITVLYSETKKTTSPSFYKEDSHNDLCHF